MDKNRLFGSVIGEEVERQRKVQRKLEAEARKQREQQELAERFQAPFKQEASRHTTNLRRLKSFLHINEARTWSVGATRNPIQKEGVVVVLEDAPKTPATPDHVAVCIAGVVRFAQNSTERREKASFNFAFVPRSKLKYVVEATNGKPLDAVRGEANPILSRSEESLRLEHIEQVCSENTYEYAGRRQRRAHRDALAGVQTRAQEFEQNLEWVLDAARNVDRNPHLFVNELLIDRGVLQAEE